MQGRDVVLTSYGRGCRGYRPTQGKLGCVVTRKCSQPGLPAGIKGAQVPRDSTARRLINSLPSTKAH